MILILVLVLTLGWSSTLLAQTPFYQGKTINIARRHQSRRCLRSLSATAGGILTKHIPGQSQHHRAKYARSGLADRRQPGLQCRQARRLELGGDLSGALFRSADQETGSEIRLGEMALDRQSGKIEPSPLHARRHAVQVDRRHPQGDHGAEMRLHRYCLRGLLHPKLLEEVLGTKFDIVSGYVSGQDIDLAVERGELQCRAFTITAYHAREPFISWRKRNFTNVLIQTGTNRDSRIKEAPTIYELMDRYKTGEAGRSLAKVILASGDFGRPIVAPPGVPADRIKILRDAFDKTLAERAFLAEAEKRRLEIDPTKWDEMESLAKDVMATPPDVVARMRKLLGE